MSVPNEDSDSESEDNEMDRLSETSGENQMNDDMEVEHETPVVSQPRAYIPGQSRPLMDDEELVMDKSAYRLFYDFKMESSSLSFDVLLDNLGAEREVELDGEPVCAYLVAGTQAARGIDNSLVVMRLSNMRPFHKKVGMHSVN
ncbi:unnamed protein product [Calicophoron daubneyi]|uniref:Histone-binding protein RBBP4-like N-terminal domain-containing protein n=1 Tax=Calicophoron daubneyi TaxID=300641 RepID=A0AAV2T7M5_CALDB